MSPLSCFWRRCPTPEERLASLRDHERRLAARIELCRRMKLGPWSIQDIESLLACIRRAIRAD